jgi:hypothetical protein
MRNHRKTRLQLLLLFTCTWACGAPAAFAQQRGADAKSAALEVKFVSPVQFGAVVVAPGLYRVTISNRGLGLVHPTTMVPVATLPVEESLGSGDINPAQAILLVKAGGVIELVVKSRTRVYTAKGTQAGAEAQANDRVELASRDGAQIGAILPEQKTELDLIHESLTRRYAREVRHCNEQAERAHWKTDDRRFWNCVCPLTQRWRLPLVKKDLRVHYPLAKGKTGLSLTITAKGRVKDCRVWVGDKPPQEIPTPPPAAAPASTTPPPTANEGEAL